MRRLAETVAGNHQNASFGKSPAELASVGAVRQPWKCCHPSGWSHPVQQAVVLRENAIEQRKVLRGYLAGASVNLVAVLQRQHRKPLPENIAGDRKIIARIMIALTPSRIVIDHPAYAQSAQTKRLREIADHRGVWEPRRRPRLRTVIDGMINLIRDKHNLPFRAEIMQALHLCIAQNRAGGAVRRIDAQQP